MRTRSAPCRAGNGVIAAAALAACALFACAGATAHGVGEHAAHAMHDHAAHAASMSKSDYARLVRSYPVPDVMLVDSSSKPVRLRDLLAADEPVMLNFIFTTCTAICPVMSAIFAQVPGTLGADGAKLRMVSISIDPENDTPRQLDAYAHKFNAGPRWQFLTGTVESVVAVERAFETYKSDKMEHEALTLLRAAPGERWVRIEGFASASDLAREYRALMQR